MSLPAGPAAQRGRSGLPDDHGLGRRPQRLRRRPGGLPVQGHEVFMVNPKEMADEAHGEEMISLEEGSFEQFLSQADDGVTVLNDTTPPRPQGHPGRFQAVLDTPLGETEISIGAVVVALDLEETPNPSGNQVPWEDLTQHDLEEALREGGPIPGTWSCWRWTRRARAPSTHCPRMRRCTTPFSSGPQGPSAR